MLFEVKVGKGKLMVSSMNLNTENKNKPAAAQLWYSIQKYMLSNAFAPTQTIDINLIRELTSKPSNFVFDAFSRATPDELRPKTIAQ